MRSTAYVTGATATNDGYMADSFAALELRYRTERQRASRARALDDDFPAVLAAFRRGLSGKDARKAAAVAVSYVQLVYGRQLQQPEDEQPADRIDVASMTREQRNALKRRLLAEHPHLVEELTR